MQFNSLQRIKKTSCSWQLQSGAECPSFKPLWYECLLTNDLRLLSHADCLVHPFNLFVYFMFYPSFSPSYPKHVYSNNYTLFKYQEKELKRTVFLILTEKKKLFFFPRWWFLGIRFKIINLWNMFGSRYLSVLLTQHSMCVNRRGCVYASSWYRKSWTTFWLHEIC